MNEIDRNLVGLLQIDATLAYAELGARVGLSASSINERLKRLKAEGIIRRIVADIDPACLGLDLLVFMLIELSDSEGESRLHAVAREGGEVLECHHLAGEFSHLLKLRLAGTAELESFLADRIKKLPGLRRAHCLIALSSIKDSRALPIDKGREPAGPRRRLARGKEGRC
jgi:Lrp/AsnC family transcriptional regulator, leucine-responsive regulatory protein